MNATLAEPVLRATRQMISGYLADHSVRHSGAVLAIDPSNVSRAVTAVNDGLADHAMRWTAAHLVAMARDDARVLGSLIALSSESHGSDADLLSTVSALLDTAQRATAAVSASSPGGASLTARERRDLVVTYLQTISRLAGAVHALNPEGSC